MSAIYKLDSNNPAKLSGLVFTRLYTLIDKPWFTLGESLPEDTFGYTDAYSDIGSSYTVTLAAPIYVNRTVHGVLGIDYFLEQISDYLREFAVNERSNMVEIMIVDRMGYVIASSSGAVVHMNRESNMPNRLLAWQINNTVLKEAAFRARPYLQTQQSTIIQYDSSGMYKASRVYRKVDGSRLLHIFPYVNQRGIDWVVVVTQSNEQLANQIRNSIYIAIGVSFAIVLIAILLSLCLGYCIVRPLDVLAVQMRRIAGLDLRHPHKNRLSQLYEFTSINTTLNYVVTGLGNFKKFVPADVVHLLLRKNASVELGVEPLEITIMFVDIVGFTSIAERTDPTVLIKILEQFFTLANTVVEKHQGIIDKYIGDAVMAVFNSPMPVHNHSIKVTFTRFSFLGCIRGCYIFKRVE